MLAREKIKGSSAKYLAKKSVRHNTRPLISLHPDSRTATSNCWNPEKLKKNGSICSEKIAKVTMNSLMSTCQCGCSETGEVFTCRSCDLTFKCEDEYDVHKNSQKFTDTTTE